VRNLYSSACRESLFQGTLFSPIAAIKTFAPPHPRFLSVAMETIVVLLFWLLLFHGVPSDEPLGMWALFNVTAHGLVAPVAWVDLLASRVRLPGRLAVILAGSSVGERWRWGVCVVPSPFPTCPDLRMTAYIIVNMAVSIAVRPVYPVMLWDLTGRSAVLGCGAGG
jgi:hypothetical protein